uniref:Addiction module antitoxin, RelB/DinJ family n=1 Tax=uncultured bacterium contig00081 TaxID=1181557 RepID=A0A806KMH7_9BACT|nr:addiction module antitoxin, RelB/DinJ family [uncultured bacterium contig00081]
MTQTSLIQVRVEENFRKEVDSLFVDLGLDTPTAIRIFLRQSLKRRGLPFEVSQYSPNAETLAAIEEVKEMKKNPRLYKSYSSVEELFEELDSDE